ncbi:hypothetical protein BH10PSE12_BH10PSE12_04320 [soil metagenome]
MTRPATDSPAPESLAAQFEALHAERVATWDAGQLAKNVAQRQDLLARFDPAKVARIGDKVAPFNLPDVDGGTLTLADLTANGPAVLIFFRFAGCPACNIALPYYNRQLWPALSAARIPLVAISPQVPDRLGEIKSRHDLGFHVASDPDNRLGRQLGITFLPSDIPDATPPGWIGEVTGTNSWELPQPSIVIVDRDQTIRFIAVSPDWLVRPEASEILQALERLDLKVAA